MNCNPSPETLVHSYAKQQIGNLGKMQLPGFTVEGHYQLHDGTARSLYWRYLPTYDLAIKKAIVECHDYEGVVPDVVIHDTDGWRLAVEVFYRHAIDAEKLEKLELLPFSSVEVDLSDLPVTSSSATLNAALRQLSRWKWLNNGYQSGHEARLSHLLKQTYQNVRIQAPSKHPASSNSTIPSKLIRDASSPAITDKAARLIATLKEMPSAKRPALLHTLDRELRLALHCYQIGVLPNQLPVHLMQTVTRQSAYSPVPVILWQTGVFAKFCMVGGSVSAQQAAFWIRSVFPGLDKSYSLYSGADNLNEYSEATFNFLNQLAEQALLERVPAKLPWNTKYKPVAQSHAEVKAKLLSFGPAKRER
ncbi:hypothetical protein [Herbaspirillum frisingense]|uniref:BioF2-like acetyltransferase domain-containing protein n=1 Tax=Herbaspirillum frisingense TaxID=92645 RepID=A0ABU1PEZ5_9BURK|nr:hypothetical protein [Herbaspirillum frisingense]MDR6584339.1 hypothetical protein [Herbaspirillum frisingense]